MFKKQFDRVLEGGMGLTVLVSRGTVGDGQYGTARWASRGEIKKTYVRVPYTPKVWWQKKNLPSAQGLVVGCKTSGGGVTTLVDTGDIHCLMIGADKDGKCYPAIGTIANELKLSRSTVKRAIGDLVKSGRIRKEQRWCENGGKSSLMFYIL